jgi:hypothetical protein
MELASAETSGDVSEAARVDAIGEDEDGLLRA